MTFANFPQLRGRDLPLWMWAIGFAEFHVQALTTALPMGITSWALFFALSAVTVAARRREWRAEALALVTSFRGEGAVSLAYAMNAALLAAILLVGFVAALRPPHFPQEYDAVHYQMGIPWQHLVRHDLGPIRWAVTDLWPMALQWGMAPF